MTKWKIVLVVLSAFVLGAGAASACYVEGYVRCDANQNGVLDPDDTPLAGVTVTIVTDSGVFWADMITDANGFYRIGLYEPALLYENLTAGLPPDATYIVPASGTFLLDTTFPDEVFYRDWLIDSSVCQTGKCWLTGGGAKFEPLAGAKLAQRGTRHSFGGNVYPGCSPTSGDGGNWNHIDHAGKMHFQGTTIEVVGCGNVPGIPPGSGSPATPYNFIEFQGTGRLAGISGNKTPYPATVYFWARCEDRNEPGSSGAKDGSLIDRYFLHVFSDPMNPVASTLMLIDTDANPGTVDPVLITDGNLQIHISSCDKPPM